MSEQGKNRKKKKPCRCPGPCFLVNSPAAWNTLCTTFFLLCFQICCFKTRFHGAQACLRFILELRMTFELLVSRVQGLQQCAAIPGETSVSPQSWHFLHPEQRQRSRHLRGARPSSDFLWFLEPRRGNNSLLCCVWLFLTMAFFRN